MTLGPQVREGELVFGVAHIFASFNDTFVHVTDLSGRETIARVTGMYRSSMGFGCCKGHTLSTHISLSFDAALAWDV